MISRKLAVFLVLLFTLSLLGGCVDDTGTGPGFTNTIKEWLEWFFVNLFKPGTDGGVTNQGLVALRILTGLLIFAILFGASQLVLKDYAKNVRLAISLLLGIISVIMIPGRLLAAVAKSYGAVFAAVMIGAPVLGGVYLMFGVFKEPNRTNWAAKLGISGILWYILGSFSNVYFLDSASKSAIMGSITGIASAVFFFMMLWYGYNVLMGEEGEEQELPEEAKKAFSAVKRWMGTSSVGSLFTEAPKLLDKLEAAIVARDVNAANKALAKEAKIIENFTELTARGQDSVKHVAGAARRDLRRIIAELAASENAITIALNGIRTALQAGPDWRTARGGVRAAQGHMRTAVANAVRLRQLIK